MSSLRQRLAALTLGAALLAGAAAGQEAPALLHHNFPLAGGPLVLVVEGLAPGEDVVLSLLDAAAAPRALAEELAASASERFVMALQDPASEPGALASLWRADARGRLLLSVPLEAADAGRPVSLAVRRLGEARGALLELRVQPPTLVLPGPSGHARLSLLDGARLDPDLPPEGGLLGLAFSDDGTRGYLLREGGRLQILSATAWAGAPLATLAFDAATDVLAGGPAGAAFLLARPGGTPFAAPGRALFLDRDQSLLLEPLAQAVAGRRVALSDDGLTAFVAEDDLVIRELDLASRTTRALLPAGLAGDRAVADLVLDGRRLLVATRGPAGRPGALTVLDLDRGWLSVLALAIDPARLVSLGEGRTLVVPADGSVAELLQDGVPAGRVTAPGSLLDAAPHARGALLLSAAADGTRGLAFLAPGSLRLQPLPGAVPPAARLVAPPAGVDGVVALLGDPSGAVHVWQPASGAIEAVPGVSATPGAPFFVAP